MRLELVSVTCYLLLLCPIPFWLNSDWPKSKLLDIISFLINYLIIPTDCCIRLENFWSWIEYQPSKLIIIFFLVSGSLTGLVLLISLFGLWIIIIHWTKDDSDDRFIVSLAIFIHWITEVKEIYHVSVANC